MKQLVSVSYSVDLLSCCSRVVYRLVVFPLSRAPCSALRDPPETRRNISSAPTLFCFRPLQRRWSCSLLAERQQLQSEDGTESGRNVLMG